ncbi:hypothetical protein FCULG_00005031 [Fusarium culmorum]|uniref:Uncharacterized protein n=1 Tax=Fusarium culmorum TaxID=5516 RepID=A0A2T4H9R3_FUSCU|nr:hypothetical protein FCULG_00005031 [Fusarium culmorum]
MVHWLMLLNTGSFRIAVESISPTSAKPCPVTTKSRLHYRSHNSSFYLLGFRVLPSPLISRPSPSLRAVDEILGPAEFCNESHSPKSTMLRTSKRH